MGQLEALTALALGRGHYEDEVVWNSKFDKSSSQRYSSRGHPKHPETKQREKDYIRAANEVMQVTGVVENAATARVKSTLDEADKQLETSIGFRLIEFGRACLHTSVWPVLGLRRRILLFRSYTTMSIVEILRQERKKYSIPHILFIGLPMALIPHVSDHLALIIEASFEYMNGLCVNGPLIIPFRTNQLFKRAIELIFSFLKIQFTLFSTLQQLNLTPEFGILPRFMSLIPFTTSSLIQFRPKPSISLRLRFLSWIRAISQTLAPILVIRSYERIQLAVSAIIYRQIYTGLPRPTGSGLLSGLPLGSPTIDNETTNYTISSTWNQLPYSLWTITSSDSENLTQQTGRDILDEDDDEMNHAQLISFEVEPTDFPDNSAGPWSAELRSVNDSKTSGATRYRLTGLTLLPNILATEELTDIIGDILVMPIEALMVRVIGAVFQASAGVKSNNMFEIGLRPRGFVNLLVTWTMQVTITGAIWAGFTLCTNWYTTQRQRLSKNSQHLVENPQS